MQRKLFQKTGFSLSNSLISLRSFEIRLCFDDCNRYATRQAIQQAIQQATYIKANRISQHRFVACFGVSKWSRVSAAKQPKWWTWLVLSVQMPPELERESERERVAKKSFHRKQ